MVYYATPSGYRYCLYAQKWYQNPNLCFKIFWFYFPDKLSIRASFIELELTAV